MSARVLLSALEALPLGVTARDVQTLARDAAAVRDWVRGGAAPLASVLRARAALAAAPPHAEARAVHRQLGMALAGRTRTALRRVRLDALREPGAAEALLATASRVNRVESAAAARRRLDAPDRVALGLYLPELEHSDASDIGGGAPLVLLEMALGTEMPDHVPPLVAADAPLADVSVASHLTLYGIATRSPGAVSGLGFGRDMVHTVCALLAPEHVATDVAVELSDADLATLTRVRCAATLSPVVGFSDASRDADARRRALRRYIAEPAAPDEACPVSRFHLGNGARIERVNVHPADLAISVNYAYVPHELKANAVNLELSNFRAMSDALQDELRRDRDEEAE